MSLIAPERRKEEEEADDSFFLLVWKHLLLLSKYVCVMCIWLPPLPLLSFQHLHSHTNSCSFCRREMGLQIWKWWERTQYFPPNTSVDKKSDVAVISLFHRKPPVAIKSHSTLPHPRESFPERWLFVGNKKKQWRSFLGCERARAKSLFLSSSSNPFSFILPEAHFRAGEGKNGRCVSQHKQSCCFLDWKKRPVRYREKLSLSLFLSSLSLSLSTG